MPDNCHFVNFERWAEKGHCQLFTHIRGRCNTLQLSRRESDCTRIVTMVAKPLFLVYNNNHMFYLTEYWCDLCSQTLTVILAGLAHGGQQLEELT